MWDGSNKLFDISAGSLMDSKPKQNQQQPAQTVNLMSNEEMNTIWNNPQPAQTQSSGFKPGINVSFPQANPMMNNMNMMQQQMMYQQMLQMQQMQQ